MSNAYINIKIGLDEAIAHAKGKNSKAIVHEFAPVDVKNLCSSVGMSQSEFASAFGISVSTLRHWERGDCTPHGPALVLLNVVAKEPEAVLRALNSKTNRRIRKKSRAAWSLVRNVSSDPVSNLFTR